MAIHTITLENGLSFQCPDDRPILYAALEQGIPLPFRCRAGACGSCQARILSGRVDQSKESRPVPTATGERRAHLCQAYALSDCRIRLESTPAALPVWR
ncbi:MAG: 2Fe-2S iron-sulfur cluster-binding protein [Synechococcaceae cyanobacterium]|nr:2Fe-2S iron-sulfur cluster-binding protein [Synechococcaceae cyanobacterium]